MSPSIAYAVGALLLYGFADFVYKRGAAAGALPHQFLMVQTWFFSSLALVLGIGSGALKFNIAALWGAAAGVLVVIGYYNFAWSLRHGAVSTNAAIFRLSFIVTTILAVVVLGESLTILKMAGFVLAVTALWLLVEPRGGSSSLVRVLVATVAVGIASFAYKLGLLAGAVPIALVVAQGTVATTITTAFTAYVDRGIRPSRAALTYAPMSAALLVAAFICLAQGLEHGDGATQSAKRTLVQLRPDLGARSPHEQAHRFA